MQSSFRKVLGSVLHSDDSDPSDHSFLPCKDLKCLLFAISLFTIWITTIMILVSYIDILDYIGNDRQCLIEGEELFNEDKVANVNVTYRATGDAYNVSAVCVHENIEDSKNSDVSIDIDKHDKKNMASKCTCDPDRFGKCEHVVATLIYLHRYPS